mmetsp:Transcript_10419/g.15688  ORF Transcript_10419/g.15688 Transcript_10419/m.15688 type:complete len:215 (-) Transcript_10419:25-669(-)
MSKVDLKIVLLGTSDVGKTSLVERFLRGSFKYDIQATVGAAFGAKKVCVGGKDITLGIWDTAGAERYESMTRIYYRHAKAAIVCYDLTRKITWDKVKFWIDELLDNEPECAIYIVGTKLDLIEEGESKQQVDETFVDTLARSVNAETWKTSAKSGTNVDELFSQIAKTFMRNPNSTGGATSSNNNNNARSNANNGPNHSFIDFEPDQPPDNKCC